MSRRLKVWMGEDVGMERSAPPPVTPAEVSYTPPNGDGTRKACSNCALWIPRAEQCFIHDSDIIVTNDMICGRHVQGTPTEDGNAALSRENLMPLSPHLSGLQRIPEGSSCDRCAFYTAQGSSQGACSAVVDGGAPIIAEALARCARWRSNG